MLSEFSPVVRLGAERSCARASRQVTAYGTPWVTASWSLVRPIRHTRPVSSAGSNRCPRCGAVTHRCRTGQCRHCNACGHAFFPGQPDTTPRAYRAFLRRPTSEVTTTK